MRQWCMKYNFSGKRIFQTKEKFSVCGTRRWAIYHGTPSPENLSAHKQTSLFRGASQMRFCSLYFIYLPSEYGQAFGSISPWKMMGTAKRCAVNERGAFSDGFTPTCREIVTNLFSDDWVWKMLNMDAHLGICLDFLEWVALVLEQPPSLVLCFHQLIDSYDIVLEILLFSHSFCDVWMFAEIKIEISFVNKAIVML